MKAKINEGLIKTLKPKDNSYSVHDLALKGFRVVVWPSGTLSFVYCYRNAEKRWLKYTIGKHGTITTAKAREIAEVKAAEVKIGVDIQSKKKEVRAKARIEKQKTLSEFFNNRYEPYCLSHMKSGKKRAAVIKRHFVDKWPDKPLMEINTWLITGWVTEKKKEKLSAGGINHPVSALKALLNRAVEWEVIDVNPLARQKALKEDRKGIVRYLSKGEEIKLREALDVRQEEQRVVRERFRGWSDARGVDKPPSLLNNVYTDYLKVMVLLALNTGMRRGEIFDLACSDIDFKQKLLTVHGKSAKSGSTRHIPLNEEVYGMLKTWTKGMPSSGLVFLSPKTRERFDNINKSWRTLLNSAGISNFRFHDLRHTFASNLVMKNCSLYIVKELLGHSSIELTQRYAHLSEDHKASAVALL